MVELEILGRSPYEPHPRGNQPYLVAFPRNTPAWPVDNRAEAGRWTGKTACGLIRERNLPHAHTQRDGCSDLGVFSRMETSSRNRHGGLLSYARFPDNVRRCCCFGFSGSCFRLWRVVILHRFIVWISCYILRGDHDTNWSFFSRPGSIFIKMFSSEFLITKPKAYDIQGGYLF